MVDGALTRKRQRKSETPQDKENYRRIERITGSFHRQFTFPDTADAQSISAKSVNGVFANTRPEAEKGVFAAVRDAKARPWAG